MRFERLTPTDFEDVIASAFYFMDQNPNAVFITTYQKRRHGFDVYSVSRSS